MQSAISQATIRYFGFMPTRQDMLVVCRSRKLERGFRGKWNLITSIRWICAIATFEQHFVV